MSRYDKRDDDVKKAFYRKLYMTVEP